jgi:hypothetical protein
VKSAGRTITGLDHAHRNRTAIQPETTHLLRGAVTAIAAFLQNWLYVATVVHGCLSQRDNRDGGKEDAR